ncbi:IS1595 family transposase [Mesorhizobium sp. ZC-5]|uniref:IS1595 family transposase n=1 Tax=Mesorhizobium sp. ZC-5 TaxID=2986066 RepID=UPI0021E86701|nr:IS1595 family transposase [Mesorhizobium sp. ZC-5]MCV3243767.1 IS1595 family transposase [Mesorhizobium sp. ZC-5]
MNLDHAIFQDADAARIHLEAQRWPHGPNCPHCGNADATRITKMEGKAHRPGLYNCMECREQFTVTVGTVFERSKIALNKWLLATFLLSSSKKGMSSHQLHRMLGVTYKTAWFMAHRIREAMKEDVKSAGPLGGEGKTVEADETYFGPKDTVKKRTIRGKPSNSSKRSIVALVERGGKARMFHVDRATTASVRDVLVRNADRKSTLFTDESNFYTFTGKEFADHATVKHTGGEYVRYEADRVVHTNTIEGVFSVFKRGMIGVYQHCGEAHLHRYLAEFDFRYNRRTALKVSDNERHDQLLAMIEGKRLTYRRIGEADHA